MPTAPALLDLITVHGPWLLFLLAILETSFVTGLVVPSGVATSLATAVALEEGVSLVPVAAAAFLGGLIGDSIGFWIGRKGRERWSGGPGVMASRVRAVHAETARFFGGHPFPSVTVARLISFVRTMMPMAAGMSSLSYPRFLTYEAAGVAIWCALYMLAGAAAEEGLARMSRFIDVGGALLLLLAGGLLWWLVRARIRRTRRRRQRA